ncbi:LuxR C-terminal-related transcriptional regulator [Streptomyces sp. NPDC058330]|uniref:LuxR C-terminal-related transcriptional regulator n=1 Tax=Streptomyces sp. NPDC058330 TaxID=3346449 RepID=UPI0036EA79B9
MPRHARPGAARAVVDALAALPHRPGLLRRPLPPVTGTVGLVVPELAGLLRPPASAADPETRRGLLPRAVGTLLEAFGDAALVLEDIHRADPATPGLLHRLPGAMPPRLRLVVTEDAAPGLPVLGVRVPGRTRLAEVRVRPWTPEETEGFVRRWPGRPRPERAGERQELAALVHELTGGLPGAAEALLRAAEETGPHTEGEGGPWAGSVLAAVREAGVPARVRRETARRCAPLDEDAWRIVEAAAVLDRAVPVGLLAEVAQVTPGRAEAAVDACVRRSVADRRAAPRLPAPLDRRAALARAPGPRLSLRAARALHRGGAGPLPLADLARLYRAAGRAREGLRCLVAAADRAADGGDCTTATRLSTQAVADDPGAGGRIRTAAKLARTAQLSRAGDQVVAAVRQVLDEDDPPPRLRGEIRLHLSVVPRNQSGGALDSLDEVARAISDLEASDPQTAARAMAVAATPAAAGGVQEVIEVCRELGARWDVARCQRLLRRHDIVTTHRRGRLGHGDQLFPREREVARLVVQGRADRDIAESLVLPTRTVEHHEARIMRKVNATSRTDIALAGWGESGAGTGGR